MAPPQARLTKSKITPSELAARWGKKPDTIIALIKSGQLAAIDVSLRHGLGRPRYLIDEADIHAFEQKRRIIPVAPRQQRQDRDTTGVIEFF